MRGAGLVQAPGPLVRAPIADGALEAVLSDVATVMPGLFLYHPGRRQMLPKLRAFIDHLTSSGRPAAQETAA